MSQKLFEYLHNELGVTALVDQMDEIKRIVLDENDQNFIDSFSDNKSRIVNLLIVNALRLDYESMKLIAKKINYRIMDEINETSK